MPCIRLQLMRREPKYAGFSLGRKLVYSKVRRLLGLDLCRGFYSGAAPLNRKTMEFFMSLDIPVFEVYGLTECSGVNEEYCCSTSSAISRSTLLR
jgi:long-chain-fatty-acid--CoA ligase ACSBG